jgi:hypothetical protein
MLRDREGFPISLQFSDGRTAINGAGHGDSEPTGPILQGRGGGGTSHSQLLPVVGMAAAARRPA